MIWGQGTSVGIREAVTARRFRYGLGTGSGWRECGPSAFAAVGHAVLRRKRHPLHRHRAELTDIVVCLTYQRRGIARRLIEALRGHAPRIGVTTIETSVRGGTPAEEVYRRVGFQECGRLPAGLVETWGDCGVYEEVFFWMPVT